MTISSLPQDILDRVEFTPVEDVLIPLLREKIPNVRVADRIEEKQPFPMILLRRHHNIDLWQGNTEFFDSAVFSIHTFTEGIDHAADGARLSEAVRVALREIARERPVIPDIGAVVYIRMTHSARPVSDWATATGPVQYADLPANTSRYESIFRATIRRRNN